MNHIHFTQAKAYDMFNALGVFVYNPTIRAWLEANDHKALEQAIDALVFHEVTAARPTATAHPGGDPGNLQGCAGQGARRSAEAPLHLPLVPPPAAYQAHV